MERFVTASATKPDIHGETLSSERIFISTPNPQEYIRDLIASCPKAGGGVHNWLYRTARKLNQLGLDKNAIIQLLEQGSANCGRAMQPHEIEDAVEASDRDLHSPLIGAEHRPPKWPEPDQEQIESISRDGARLADLKRISPLKWDGMTEKQHTDEIIDILFPGNPLLCMGLSMCVFNTRRREAWRGELALKQFIVPSPMCKTVGWTKDAKPSTHTLDGTGPRRFLVVEFDKGDLDQHAAILLHLGKSAPLAMVVYSGKKSLHGWFYVEGQPDARVENFFRDAVTLGADSKLWTRSQFVRLPDGWRAGNQRRQWTLFLNPQVVRGH